ncbi:MAG: efflux RND transporter periplasmic adaptor subunit, partial [Muribaculaceae bacterium]|nr:efflux RND transporter periplasmic adaptor subunit [Muribaculaceae bacterium]
MKRFLKILLWALIAAVFVGTFVYLFNNSKPKAVTYDILSPSTTTIERATVLTGKIEPRDEIEIKPQISGIISEVNIEPGDIVHEGDVIAKIKVIPDDSQLNSARNRLDIAKLTLSQAESVFNRTKELYDKKYASREEFEQAQTEYLKAKEEVASAADALSIVKEGVSKYTAQQSNTLVRATITGQVLEVPVKVGSSVIQANTMTDGTTVAKVADMNNLIFKGKVDETEVGLLRQGMPMVITIGALPDVTYDGEIEYIAPKSTE